MRIFIVFISLLGAFFLEQILNFPGSSVSLNILTILSIFYFTGKNFQEDLAIAGFVGFLYDLTSVNFFGTHILIFILACLCVRFIVNKFFPVNMNFLNTQITVAVGLMAIVTLKIILFSSLWLGKTNFKMIITSFYWSDILSQILISGLLMMVLYPFWRLTVSIKDKYTLDNHGNI